MQQGGNRQTLQIRLQQLPVNAWPCGAPKLMSSNHQKNTDAGNFNPAMVVAYLH